MVILKLRGKYLDFTDGLTEGETLGLADRETLDLKMD